MKRTRLLAWIVGLCSSVAAFSWAATDSSSASAPPQAVRSGVTTLIVLDASGSMRERIKGESKMEIAKRSVRELVESLPDGVNLGLVVYSHRSLNDCKDIELLIPPAALDRAAFVAAVEKLKPRGMTPISDALTFAAKELDYRNKPACIILVSDGEETCGKDPCATAAKLEAAAADLIVHTVAFDMSAREAKSIACIARATGGRFLQAKDAASLKDALAVVVAESVAPPPPPAPEPPPPPPIEEVRPVTPQPEPLPPPPPPPPPVTITADPVVLAGSEFPVSWTGPNGSGDFITIVSAGTPDEDDGNLTYTRQGSPLQLTALEDAGEGELRYVDGSTHAVLARAPIKVSAVDATLDAQAEATAGSVVSVAWTGPNNPGDYITIVPKGTPDREYAHYANTRQGTPVSVRVPMDPGESEIRYVSGQRGKILARRPINVLPAVVSLEAADEARVESEVAITWTGPDNEGDYITVVPLALPDGQYAKYAPTRSGSPAKVAVPAEPGDGEIRYMSGQGGRVLARRPIRLVASEASLQGPDEAPAEAVVEVAWTGPNNSSDYITIVPVGARDGEYLKYANTRSGSPARVGVPAEPGDCEIRYVTGAGKVLARRPIKIVATGATLDAPDEAGAEAVVAVTWTGPNNNGDYITIVPVGARDGEYLKYANTRSGSPARVGVPAEPGECEVRYVTGAGKVLARRPLRVIAVQVSLSAPAEAVAESPVEVAWTGPNNNGDYITIVAKSAPDSEYAKYAYTRQGSPLKVNAPPKAGDAEVRYRTGGGKVLARIPIRILEPSISLQAPSQVKAGGTFQITWTGPNNPGDYLSLVKKSAPDGARGKYTGTNRGSPLNMQASTDLGAAEIRYMSGQSGKVLARLEIEIVDHDVPDAKPASSSTGPAPGTPSAGAKAKPVVPEMIGAGEPMDIEEHLVPGKTVIFAFVSGTVPDEMADPRLNKYHAEHADVVVIKVNIDRPNRRLREPRNSTFNIDFNSPLAEQYGVQGIPAFIVYGPDGKLLMKGDEADKWVWKQLQ